MAYHAALHPPIAAQTTPETALSFDAIALNAPMLQISSESRPSKLVEFCAHCISLFAGRLGVATAIRGNISNDSRYVHGNVIDTSVEVFARNDYQTYHGLVHVDTGLAILKGLAHLTEIAHTIQCPVMINNGDADRVTNYRGSQQFYDCLRMEDKVIKIWPGIEHGALP